MLSSVISMMLLLTSSSVGVSALIQPISRDINYVYVWVLITRCYGRDRALHEDA